MNNVVFHLDFVLKKQNKNQNIVLRSVCWSFYADDFKAFFLNVSPVLSVEIYLRLAKLLSTKSYLVQ